MIRAGRRRDSIGRALTGLSLGELLEPALGALEGPDRRLSRKFCVGQPDEPVPHGLEAKVQIEGTRDGLEGRRQQGWTPTATTLRLTFAKHQPLAEFDPAGKAGETGRRDDGSAAGAQVSLILVRMTGVERLGDGQVDHGVTQEFKAFVVPERGVTMLVVPTRMDEGLLEQVDIPDGQPDPGCQGLGGTHDAVARPSPIRRD